MHGRVRPAHRHRPQRIRRPLPDVIVHDGAGATEAIRQTLKRGAAAQPTMVARRPSSAPGVLRG